MNKMFIIPLLLFCSNLLHSQKSIDKVLKTFNNNSVPYISSQELSKLDNNIILLDAREANEYEVSHLKNAIFVGFDKFDMVSKRPDTFFAPMLHRQLFFLILVLAVLYRQVVY